MAEDPERYLAAAAEILAAEGLTDAAEILRKSTPRVDKTGYDNWNGGTTIWTIFLLLDPAAYALISGKRESLQKQIKERLEPILSQFTDDWYSVTIAPKVDPLPEWRHAAGDVSSATRQNIVDGMKIDRVHWAGRLEDVEFLQRLYDLESMPSSDKRFRECRW
jgi:AbiJ N-terminal domain 3